MEVALPDRAPVHELDARLEGATGRAQELVLVDVEHAVEAEDRRDRRLANSDGADRIRFDQGDSPPAVVEKSRERGRRHPSGGAPADDHDVGNYVIATATCASGGPFHPHAPGLSFDLVQRLLPKSAITHSQ